MAHKYIFEPLPEEVPSLRIIQTIWRRDDGKICLCLQNMRLEDVKDGYDAISYTWGTDEPIHKVLIEDKPLWLQKNIFSFLEHSLDVANNFQGPLWIDSICINQKDVDEKSHQVQMMGDIFSQARRVLIWLDEISRRDPVSPCRWALSKIAREDATYLDDNVFSKLRHPKYWRVVDELALSFCHDYWQRLWTYQELVLAKDVQLISGVSRISMSGMFSIVPFVKREFEGLWQFQRTWESRRHYSAGSVNTRELLRTSTDRKCRDVRDRVYGLQAMARESQRLQVRYDRGKEELFSETLCQWLCTRSSGSIPEYSSNFLLEDVQCLRKALEVTSRGIDDFVNRMPPTRTALTIERRHALRVSLSGSVIYLRFRGEEYGNSLPRYTRFSHLESESESLWIHFTIRDFLDLHKRNVTCPNAGDIILRCKLHGTKAIVLFSGSSDHSKWLKMEGVVTQLPLRTEEAVMVHTFPQDLANNLVLSKSCEDICKMVKGKEAGHVPCSAASLARLCEFLDTNGGWEVTNSGQQLLYDLHYEMWRVSGSISDVLRGE